MPNLVDQADDWIWVQIWEGRHPHWLKELRALYRSCLVGELQNIHALQFAQQQAATFRLPLAHVEASGWWEAPCSLSALHHWDFLPQVHSPDSRDFCIARQEETLALAQALQCSVERSGMLPRVLSDAVQYLQSCIAPLMDSNMIVSFMVGPTDNRPIMSPTSEEEAVLLGDEPQPQDAQEVTMSSPECPEIPEPEEPTEQADIPSHLPLHPWPPTTMLTSPGIPVESSLGLELSIC